MSLELPSRDTLADLAPPPPTDAGAFLAVPGPSPTVPIASGSAARPSTLADVLARLTELDDLPRQRRHDFASAVRRVADLIGMPASDIPADAPTLRRRLALLTPAGAGMTERRFRNVLSLLTAALSLVGASVARNRSLHKLSPAWTALLGRVGDRYERARLSRFFGFATARGVEPEAVSDAEVECFAQHLANNSLVERQTQIVRDLCLAWNRCAADIENWPAVRLTVPNRRRDYALKIEDYPASFGADIMAYLNHLSGEDLFAETGRHAASPTTIKDVRLRILEIAAAQVVSGRATDAIKTLADLVTPEAIKTALTFFWSRNGKRKTGQIHNFSLLAVNIAKHWVKAPPAELEALKIIRRQVDPGHSGMTGRNRQRLRQFDDPETLRRLIELPYEVLRSLPKDGEVSFDLAIRMQSAVAVAILQIAPLRVKNLAGLRLGLHITQTRQGGARHLVIPGQEVKNGAPLSFELPESLREIMDVYVKRCRPALAVDAGGYLFPARKGGAKTPAQLAAQIKRMIVRETGIDLNVHAFRHLAARIFLRENPGEYESVRLLLGHKDLNTTVRAYCGLEQADAFRRLDALIGRHRR